MSRGTKKLQPQLGNPHDFPEKAIPTWLGKGRENQFCGKSLLVTYWDVHGT